MTILICGASGILGRELCNLLDKLDVSYIGTYNTNKIKKGININFFNINEIDEIIKQKNITICVNCIVERQVETCEKNWNIIKKINVDITNNLSKVCKINNIYLIHISTDYVFDGLNPPYYPNSIKNPLQNYGISKLLAEMKVIINCNNYCIIRVPVLYTNNINNLQDTAVTLIGKKILNRLDTFTEDNYSIRRPNYIPDFCYFLYNCIKEKNQGIYHFCNPYDKITKYEMANIIANYLNKTLNITPINSIPNDNIERPLDTQLLDDKYDIHTYSFTPIREGIEKCFNKLYHPKLTLNNNENTNDILFLIDLDGTIINTDKLHYYAYRDALKEINNFNLTEYDYNNALSTIGINNYLDNNFSNKNEIKYLKNTILQKNSNIELMDGAYELINYIYKYNINHVVVTNTSNSNVDFFKSKQPELSKLKNWIVREDYNNAKPNSECYKLALKLYYNNEKYIIGIENTFTGFQSIKSVTDCIYIMTNNDDDDLNKCKNEDVYIINNLKQIFYDC